MDTVVHIVDKGQGLVNVWGDLYLREKVSQQVKNRVYDTVKFNDRSIPGLSLLSGIKLL